MNSLLPSIRTSWSNHCLIALALLASTPLAAQSLDEEYSRYLEAACTAMNFSRDNQANILPGQAGPQLTAFCNGPVPVGAVFSTSASGGDAGVAANANEDTALTRRRHRKDNATSEANTQDYDTATFGNIGLFLSLDYLREKHDATHFEGGRRSDSLATTLGADYRIGSRGIVGVAARYERTSGDFVTGGDYRIAGHGIAAYGSWFPANNLFVDFNVGTNFRSNDTNRSVSLTRTLIFLDGTTTSFLIIPVAQATSNKDSDDYNAQVSAGYDFSNGSLTIGPRVSVIALTSTADAYTESGNTPMALVFDKQKSTSLRSTVGAQVSRAFTPATGVFVAQMNLDWQHEYKDDQHSSTAHFAEDLRAAPTQLRFLNEAPDRDAFTARVSVVAIFAHEVSAFVSTNALFGHSYLSRYGASLGIRKTF